MEEVVTAFQKVDETGAGDSPMACFTTPDTNAIRNALVTKVNPAMKTAYSRALTIEPFQPAQIPTSFIADFLVLG